MISRQCYHLNFGLSNRAAGKLGRNPFFLKRDCVPQIFQRLSPELSGFLEFRQPVEKKQKID
jgi:hypothetical protein